MNDEVSDAAAVPRGQLFVWSRLFFFPGLVILAATLVMWPRVGDAQFGLLDDGVTLSWGARGESHGIVPTLGEVIRVDADRGVHRPVHWLHMLARYRLSGLDPTGWFAANFGLLVATAILLGGAVRVLGAGAPAAGLAGVAFVASAPVFEAYYTLSKLEPLSTLLLVGSALLLFVAAERTGRWNRPALVASVATLAVAYFSKETAFGMSVTAVAWAGAARRLGWGRRWRVAASWYAGASLVLVPVYFMARRMFGVTPIGGGLDSRQYVFGLEPAVASLLRQIGWLFTAFPHVVYLIVFLVLTGSLVRGTRAPEGRACLLGVAWIAGAFAVLLPWHSTLLYYLLAAAAGAAIVVGVGTVEMLRWAAERRGSVAAAVVAPYVVLLAVSLANATTYGRIQLAIDRSNSAMVAALAEAAPRGARVAVHLDASGEYHYELPLHLRILHERADVQVEAFPEIGLQPGTLIVFPEMSGQHLPAVRIGVQQPDAELAAREVDGAVTTAAEAVETVATVRERVRLAFVQLDRPLVAPLLGPDAWRETFYSGRPVPWVDVGVFTYGWKIQRITVSQ